MESMGSQPTAPSDGDLVRSVLAGKRQAFDDLVRRHFKAAVSLAYLRLGNTEDAQEVAQEAFMRAYTGLDTLHNPDAFVGWLLRTVSNLALNFRRGRRLRKNPGLDEAIVSGDHNPGQGGVQSDFSVQSVKPSRALEDRELGDRRRQAMAQLPEKQRLAIEMFAIEGRSQKDVADALDCSVEAVKWYVFQGRKKLRELLADVI